VDFCFKISISRNNTLTVKVTKETDNFALRRERQMMDESTAVLCPGPCQP